MKIPGRTTALLALALVSVAGAVYSQNDGSSNPPVRPTPNSGAARDNARDHRTDAASAPAQSDTGQSGRAQNQQNSQSQQNASSKSAGHKQVEDLLTGYYGGYSDGYIDGLEDAVYYIIDLHHKGQDTQSQQGDVPNEQMRQHRDELRSKMRSRQSDSGTEWSHSANTKRINGVIVDQWVGRENGQKHQFVELETSQGTRYEVDLGSPQALGTAQLKEHERISVRGEVRDPKADHPILVAHKVWIGDGQGIAVHAGQLPSSDRANAQPNNVQHARHRMNSVQTSAIQAPAAYNPSGDQPKNNAAASQSRGQTVDVRLGNGPRGRAFLGVQLDHRDGREARITHVYPDSPATAIGLQPGDVILAINDRQLSSPADLTSVVEQLRGGDVAHLLIAHAASPQSQSHAEDVHDQED